MARPILTAFLNLFGYNAHRQNPHQPSSAHISQHQPMQSAHRWQTGYMI